MPQNLMIYLLAAAVTLNTEETQTTDKRRARDIHE